MSRFSNRSLGRSRESQSHGCDDVSVGRVSRITVEKDKRERKVANRQFFHANQEADIEWASERTSGKAFANTVMKRQNDIHRQVVKTARNRRTAAKRRSGDSSKWNCNDHARERATGLSQENDCTE